MPAAFPFLACQRFEKSCKRDNHTQWSVCLAVQVCLFGTARPRNTHSRERARECFLEGNPLPSGNRLPERSRPTRSHVADTVGASSGCGALVAGEFAPEELDQLGCHCDTRECACARARHHVCVRPRVSVFGLGVRGSEEGALVRRIDVINIPGNNRHPTILKETNKARARAPSWYLPWRAFKQDLAATASSSKSPIRIIVEISIPL